jgi:hypothetical protein
MRHTTWTSALLLAAMVGAPGVARADNHMNFEPNFIESVFGATNVDTIEGNGRLTVGVSRDGDVSVFSWPSPTYYDHLHYMTSNAPDARLMERFGALDSMGIYGGLAVDLQGQGTLESSFFLDGDWTIESAFLGTDTSVIETTYTHMDWGVTVRQLDVVPPDRDVLIRRYEVTRDASSMVDTAYLIGYSNLSPTHSKVAQLPLADAFIDHKSDYMAVWSEAAEAIIHFHPDDTGLVTSVISLLGPLTRNFGPLGEMLKSTTLDAMAVEMAANRLDEDYSTGVYIAHGSTPSPDQYQVGYDKGDTCGLLGSMVDNLIVLVNSRDDIPLPLDANSLNLLRCNNFDPLETPRSAEEWQHDATDALTDAADGELEGNPLAGAQVNTAIRVPLDFGTGDTAQAALFYAMGETSDEATALLRQVRGEDLDQVQQDAVTEDEQWVSQLWFPPALDQDLLEFSKRTMLDVRVGTDRATGAIVASISRQPPYQLDWPRDGVFFNVALDIAGLNDLVEQRLDFYADVMRDMPRAPIALINEKVPGWPSDPDSTAYPADSYEMNYYSDGVAGGNVRLEIDNTALVIWNYAYHAGHVPEDELQAYLEKYWPTVKRGAEWLYSWRDPETGLNWPANEDDHSVFTQGLQGAETTFAALVGSARIATYLGHDEEAGRWLRRAGELRNATLEIMYVEGEGFLNVPPGQPDRIGAGPPNWLYFPSHFLPRDDERLREQMRKDLAFQLGRVSGEAPSGGYPTKAAISGALLFEDGDPEREQAFEIGTRLVRDIAEEDTYTLGESFQRVDVDGDKDPEDWINAVSTPHLWSMSLVYLTFVAYHNPERFDLYRDVLPVVEVPDVAPGALYDTPDMGGADMGPDMGTAGDMGGAQDGGEESSGCGCRQVDARRSGGGEGALALLAGLLAAAVMRRRRRA